MFGNSPRVTIGILAAALLGAGEPAATQAPFWGKLAPGPFAVGFRSLWQLDYSRVYNTIFDDKTSYSTGKAPRPILINIWYPAERSNDSRSMAHRDYLKIATEDPRLARFAAKLADYERGIVCKEIMGKTVDELTATERAQLDRLGDTPTACLRDAAALDARFPLVIYHSGAQSSFEDNAVLCEFLASHGYVVIGSAFPEATGRSLAVDGRQGSARDLEFLIAHARRQPNVDWTHIGLVGHSLGAQAILMFRAQDASPVDAVVSLDTTQDYYSLATPGWVDMTRLLRENAHNMNGPLLMAANACAFFELADSLKDAERFYFTLRDQDHNDFIMQGIQSRTVLGEAKPDDRELRSSLESARAGYEAVCESVLAFFDVYLKNQTRRREQLQKYEATRLGGDQPHVDHVPRGATGPQPFREDQGSPPSPRQLRPVLSARGLQSTLSLLQTWHQRDPQAPVFDRDFGFALVEECLASGRIPDAIAFYRLYATFDKTFPGIFVKQGDAYRRVGAKTRARHYYKLAIQLEPSNAEAAERLKALDSAAKDSK